MNILITGAGGFIGKSLYNYYKSKHNIYQIFSQNTQLTSTKEKVFSADLVNDNQVLHLTKALSKIKKIDVVFHLASKFISTNNPNDIDVLFDNISITKNIAQLALILKPKHLINFSSMAVYPNSSGTYSEESPVSTYENFECIYGLSKICSENLFSFLLKENTKTLHLRLSQVYGSGMRKDRIISMMKQELISNNLITVHGEGERISNFIDINKLLSIIDILLINKIGGIYNIGDKNLSYHELANKIKHKYGNKESKIRKLKKGSRSKFRLDTTKLENLIKSL